MTLLLDRPRPAAEPPERVAAPPDSWWARLTRGCRRLWQRPDWPHFAGDDWVERLMEMTATDDFHVKQGRSTGRFVLEREGQTLSVYLKRHYELPRLHGLLAALWPRRDWSPALQEFRNLAWARRQGLLVPKVVAAGEFLHPWGRLQSFLAIEELQGMIGLHQAVPLACRQLDPRRFCRWKAGLIREMARLTRCLHDARRFHKDLYLCHFYVPRSDTECVPAWPGRVHMIDFHRLAHHPWTWPIYRLKDIAQLLYSSDVEGVVPRDRLRFWRHYLAPRPVRSARLLAWLIQLKGGRYRGHNAKLNKGVPA